MGYSRIIEMQVTCPQFTTAYTFQIFLEKFRIAYSSTQDFFQGIQRPRKIDQNSFDELQIAIDKTSKLISISALIPDAEALDGRLRIKKIEMNNSVININFFGYTKSFDFMIKLNKCFTEKLERDDWDLDDCIMKILEKDDYYIIGQELNDGNPFFGDYIKKALFHPFKDLFMTKLNFTIGQNLIA